MNVGTECRVPDEAAGRHVPTGRAVVDLEHGTVLVTHWGRHQLQQPPPPSHEGCQAQLVAARTDHDVRLPRHAHLCQRTHGLPPGGAILTGDHHPGGETILRCLHRGGCQELFDVVEPPDVHALDEQQPHGGRLCSIVVTPAESWPKAGASNKAVRPHDSVTHDRACPRPELHGLLVDGGTGPWPSGLEALAVGGELSVAPDSPPEA
mmetsp:Transcript_14929/g.46773  ORF Transcript_14929/g.46773 Transcript_14929/m.46773 type:complete len:207 (-) Transcript_14929:189-809(-)